MVRTDESVQSVETDTNYNNIVSVIGSISDRVAIEEKDDTYEITYTERGYGRSGWRLKRVNIVIRHSITDLVT